MIKMEIKFDEEKVTSAGSLNFNEIKERLDKIFLRFPFDKIVCADGTISYKGRGSRHDFALFGKNILLLKRQDWFMNNINKWLWFNSSNGNSEDDFSVEDILYFYTGRASLA